MPTDRKEPEDKTIRIPLPPDEAMADLLKVPPPPEKKRRGQERKEPPKAACPECGSEFSRIDLMYSLRKQDGKKLCELRAFCPNGHGPFYRWEDRAEPWRATSEVT